MKLYITTTSPYARIVRILILEKALEERVEVIEVKTRQPGSPYYAINPSGRVPHLVTEAGEAFEESALICDYLDHIDGTPRFANPSWEARRLEAWARSLLDGLAVWARELRRPENERSPGILDHERERALRLVDDWERRVRSVEMTGPLNLAQITLAVALQIDARLPEFRWRGGRPGLEAWEARLAALPSIVATRPA